MSPAKSWRTTILGIVTIATSVLAAVKVYLATGSLQSVDTTATLTAITAGLGLIQARDQSAHVADVVADATAPAKPCP
jgi:hypothetical protein